MRILLLLLAAGSVAACSNDMTAPAPPSPDNSLSAANGNALGGPWGYGRRGFGMMGGGMMFARRLPTNLQLTDAQKTQIKALMTTYRTAHQDDLKSMASVGKQMRAMRVAGQNVSADQRKALFAQTAPARQRLMAANKQLRADVEKVLTDEQKSWLASHRPSFRRTPNRVKRSA